MDQQAYLRLSAEERSRLSAAESAAHDLFCRYQEISARQYPTAEGKKHDAECDWFKSACEEIHANKLRHGWKVTTADDWENQHEIPAVLMLITSEVAEALEAFRKNDRDNFEEELADVMIRTMGLAHGMGIDLKAQILAKVEKNRNREHRHGGKRV